MKGIHHIRIISPSGVIDPSYIDEACARLRAWGYIVSVGVHAREVCGRFAGTDEARLSDLADAIQDPSVDAILCARGGYGLQRILDRIPPITKPVIGFSDITALHQLSAISRQPSLHSIMCKHIATLPEESEELRTFRRAIEGEELCYRWESHPLNRFGEAEGLLIGGNLSVLYGLQGTNFSIQHSAISIQRPVLLIEDICERHYHIDRMMRNLKMSGALANLSGLIVGQFTDCEDDPLMGCSVYETIKEAVAEYDYPVLFNAPFGHVEHNLPLWQHGHSTIHCGADGVLLTNRL
jgi:muramoyltetrapeptide carboxypeptidase